ncbi:MAG: DUF1800 domain-containing protein [Fuerstiella sp.]|jgi:uncharacterized protein (DUF1800 family)|nr:DUF1800 domain-containing protein [Fuerstiella sp.]
MKQAIDPEWAWTEFQPDADTPWNLRAAAHLYRRAGFGANHEELTTAVEAGAVDAADNLLGSAAEPEDYRHEVTDLAHASMASGNVQQLSAWWAYRMLSTPSQLLEKLTLLWHGHFATSAQKVEDAKLMFDQNNLLRKYALGNFARLLQEISRDPAMLIYLDSVTNRKAHPNENYAREIMELFCLGEGNYTENDIRELARCFTGWEVKNRKFRFNRYQHDTKSKSFLGHTGNFGGEEGVRIVAGQDAAPQFVAMKLVKFMVMDEPSPSAELLAPLARELRSNEMQIAPTIRRILTSNIFYSAHARGRKVRSPVELAIGFLRSLEGSTNSYELAEKLQTLGQGLLYPPSVKGWDGGRTWINSSTLLGRSNLIRSLLDHEKTRFGKTSLNEYLASEDAESADEIIDWFQTSMFAVDIPAAARERIRTLLSGGNNRDEKLKDGVHALCTLPEFQLC